MLEQYSRAPRMSHFYCQQWIEAPSKIASWYFSNVGIVGCKLNPVYCKIRERYIIMIWTITCWLKLHKSRGWSHSHHDRYTTLLHCHPVYSIPGTVRRWWKGCHEMLMVMQLHLLSSLSWVPGPETSLGRQWPGPWKLLLDRDEPTSLCTQSSCHSSFNSHTVKQVSHHAEKESIN